MASAGTFVWYFWVTFCVVSIHLVVVICRKPNIVFIVADDLGWNDIGYNNPDIISPNLNKLAETGVKLNQSYVQYVCTPSRSTFMTGYYPFRTGLQHANLQTLIPAGVPTKYKFLPESLRELGYETHIVGKWHLGYCNWSYTPTYRGFDSFLGYYTGSETYYSHEDNGHFDFRNNTEVERNRNNTYSTTIFRNRAVEIIGNNTGRSKPLFLYLPFQAVHAPLQVPQQYIDMYKNVKDENRRNFSAMVTALDDAIGNVVAALKSNGLYNNSVIIWTTDNGGQVLYGGNNYPLRGNKATLWEGGTRGVAFVHSPLLQKTAYVNDGLIHSVDWFPTLVALAGGKPVPGMDGMNQWPTISSGLNSPRQEFVYNIDNYDDKLNAAIRVKNYKLIVGDPGSPDGWIPPAHIFCDKGNRTITKPQFRLFNINDDPTEHFNLADSEPQKVKELWRVLLGYVKQAVKPFRPAPDPHGNPKYWGGAYSPGWCQAI